MSYTYTELLCLGFSLHGIILICIYAVPKLSVFSPLKLFFLNYKLFYGSYSMSGESWKVWQVICYLADFSVER